MMQSLRALGLAGKGYLIFDSRVHGEIGLGRILRLGVVLGVLLTALFVLSACGEGGAGDDYPEGDVEIMAPKSRQSEPKNVHIATFV